MLSKERVKREKNGRRNEDKEKALSNRFSSFASHRLAIS
jgi:hypothetical protein